MATGGCTTTGVREARQHVDAFPRTSQLALRSVAFRVSRRVMNKAKQLLLSQTKGSGATAARIRVEEDEQRKAYVVKSTSPAGKPANLVLWIERGTARQPARPYMGPANDGEREYYQSEMQRTTNELAANALG